jgi:hypothetical protein
LCKFDNVCYLIDIVMDTFYNKKNLRMRHMWCWKFFFPQWNFDIQCIKNIQTYSVNNDENYVY